MKIDYEHVLEHIEYLSKLPNATEDIKLIARRCAESQEFMRCMFSLVSSLHGGCQLFADCFDHMSAKTTAAIFLELGEDKSE